MSYSVNISTVQLAEINMGCETANFGLETRLPADNQWLTFNFRLETVA